MSAAERWAKAQGEALQAQAVAAGGMGPPYCTHEIIVRSWCPTDRLYYARCKACGVESHGPTLRLASLAFICEHL